MSQGSNSLPLRQEYLVALGANLPSVIGSPSATIHEALNCTHQYRCKLLSVSRFFSTPAFPAGNGPDYVNAAAQLEVARDAKSVLNALHEVEAEFGRERVQRWGQRTLDLDLIAIDDEVHPDQATFHAWRDLPPQHQAERTPEQLILPHPRLQDRAFVLVPLADVAPTWRHPVLGQTVAAMRDALDPADLREVVPI